MGKYKIVIDFEIESPLDVHGMYDDIIQHILDRLRDIAKSEENVKTSVKVNKEYVEG